VCAFAGPGTLADNQGIFIRSRERRPSDSHERKQTRKRRSTRQSNAAFGSAGNVANVLHLSYVANVRYTARRTRGFVTALA